MAQYKMDSSQEQNVVQWSRDVLGHQSVSTAQVYPGRESAKSAQLHPSSQASMWPSGIRLPSVPSYNTFTPPSSLSTSVYRPGNISQPQQPPGLISSQQQQLDESQKLLARLATQRSSAHQPFPQFPTISEQLFLAAAAEEAKVLDSRKLAQEWQVANNEKLSKRLLGGTADQLWLDAQGQPELAQWAQEQQQRQLLAQRLGNHHSLVSSTQRPPSGLERQTTDAFLSLTHHHQEINSDSPQQQEEQSHQQPTSQQITALKHVQQQMAFLLSQQQQQQLTRLQQGLIIPKPFHSSLGSLLGQVTSNDERRSLLAASLKNQTEVSPFSEASTTSDPDNLTGVVTSSTVETVDSTDSHMDETDANGDEDANEVKDVEMSDQDMKNDTSECLSDVRIYNGQCREAKMLEKNGIEGITTETVDVDVQLEQSRSGNQMSSSRMHSILDFELECDNVKDSDGKATDESSQSDISKTTEERDTDKDATPTQSDERHMNSASSRFDYSPISTHNTPSSLRHHEPSQCATLRIEERLLSEKLTVFSASATPAPNSNTNSTSSIISGASSPPRISPPPTQLPPQSSSSNLIDTAVVCNAPPTASYCRAPGLGPVSVSEVASGSNLPLVCPVCGFSCNSKFHYNSHMNTHGDHQCSMCDYTSRTEGRLKKHMRDSHTVDEQIAAGIEIDTGQNSNGSISTTNHSRASPTNFTISTTMASLVEAANAAALAAAAESDGSTDSHEVDENSKNALTSDEVLDGSVDSVKSAMGNDESSVPRSALDQIRAFTEGASVLGDLSSSASLASALISRNLFISPSTDSSDTPSASLSLAAESSDASMSNHSERRTSAVGGAVKPKIYKCKQCNHVSASKDEQWTHARTHIPPEKQLGCTRCGFVTEYKHHLEYHLRNHMGSKPFHCKKCAYSCVNKSMLNSHMKSHTNVYQFRCRDCTYATKYCHSLKLHLKKYGHCRAGDSNESIGKNDINGSPYDNSEDQKPLLHFNDSFVSSSGNDSPHLSLSTSQSLLDNGGTFGSAPSPSDNANLASQLLLRQQQLEQVEAMIRLSSLTGFSAINAATSFAQQQRCSLCDYVSLNIDDLLRHQVSHLISDPVNSPLSSICNSVDNVVALNNTDDINSKLHGNIDLRQLIGKPEVNVKLKPFLSVLEQSEVAEHDQMLSVDADGDTQVNDSSDDQHQSPTESSKSCCEDGQSSSTEDISEKGARKRKAALKLSQIAARLHEKNSPGIEDGTHSEASDTTVDVASEMRNRRTAGLTDTRASSRDPLAESHQTVNVNPTIPLIRPVPGGINIFQQACLAQMHDMEQKLRTAIGMWRFSCPHCRIAFHDEPLFHIHMGYHGYENAFKCNRCGQSCSDCLTFNLHLLQAKH